MAVLKDGTFKKSLGHESSDHMNEVIHELMG